MTFNNLKDNSKEGENKMETTDKIKIVKDKLEYAKERLNNIQQSIIGANWGNSSKCTKEKSIFKLQLHEKFTLAEIEILETELQNLNDILDPRVARIGFD